MDLVILRGACLPQSPFPLVLKGQGCRCFGGGSGWATAQVLLGVTAQVLLGVTEGGRGEGCVAGHVGLWDNHVKVLCGGGGGGGGGGGRVAGHVGIWDNHVKVLCGGGRRLFKSFKPSTN